MRHRAGVIRIPQWCEILHRFWCWIEWLYFWSKVPLDLHLSYKTDIICSLETDLNMHFIRNSRHKQVHKNIIYLHLVQEYQQLKYQHNHWDREKSKLSSINKIISEGQINSSLVFMAKPSCLVYPAFPGEFYSWMEKQWGDTPWERVKKYCNIPVKEIISFLNVLFFLLFFPPFVLFYQFESYLEKSYWLFPKYFHLSFTPNARHVKEITWMTLLN